MDIYNAADLYKAKVLPSVDGKSAEWFARQITNTAARGALAQTAVALAFLNIRDDKAQRDIVDLAREIVLNQVNRCAQYGTQAHPLSDKQIAVIASAIAKEV